MCGRQRRARPLGQRFPQAEESVRWSDIVRHQESPVQGGWHICDGWPGRCGNDGVRTFQRVSRGSRGPVKLDSIAGHRSDVEDGAAIAAENLQRVSTTRARIDLIDGDNKSSVGQDIERVNRGCQQIAGAVAGVGEVIDTQIDRVKTIIIGCAEQVTQGCR